jgi:hypothetical protein
MSRKFNDKDFNDIHIGESIRQEFEKSKLSVANLQDELIAREQRFTIFSCEAGRNKEIPP